MFEKDRIYRALILFRLGIKATDDIIRADAWMYAALRLLEGEQVKFETAEAERKAKRGV